MADLETAPNLKSLSPLLARWKGLDATFLGQMEGFQCHICAATVAFYPPWRL